MTGTVPFALATRKDVLAPLPKLAGLVGYDDDDDDATAVAYSSIFECVVLPEI